MQAHPSDARRSVDSDGGSSEFESRVKETPPLVSVVQEVMAAVGTVDPCAGFGEVAHNELEGIKELNANNDMVGEEEEVTMHVVRGGTGVEHNEWCPPVLMNQRNEDWVVDQLVDLAQLKQNTHEVIGPVNDKGKGCIADNEFDPIGSDLCPHPPGFGLRAILGHVHRETCLDNEVVESMGLKHWRESVNEAESL
ncbi:hypothetical protein PIB30_096900 [Stylosanthes scabra]|uniref:Uncharacterized protein n=1 Tax=Stylosanthes scabra TaxID=79078 RepID=A0ABU6QVH3_9FABA|nr:hypothetical protein [Stylosanthes scabra]